MLDSLIGGGFGHKDHRGHGPGRGYGFKEYKEHKEFVSHEESGGGFFDHHGRFDNHLIRPANHGRSPMTHMSVCEEEEEYSDREEYYESSHKQQMVMGHHNNNNQFHHGLPPPPKRHMDQFPPAYNGNQHHNRLMAPHVPPHNMYMAPNHGSHGGAGGSAGYARVRASENWRVNHNGGGHQTVGWGSKAL